MSILTEGEIDGIFDATEETLAEPWFLTFGKSIESAVLAKLAGMELPANAPHITRRIRACESEVPAQVVFEHALRQAYAQGAASQLHQEPALIIREGDSDIIPAGTKLFTLKEVK